MSKELPHLGDQGSGYQHGLELTRFWACKPPYSITSFLLHEKGAMIAPIRIRWDALSYRPWETHLHLLKFKRGFVGQHKSSEKGTAPSWI